MPAEIPYDWGRVECPTCGAQPDSRCRALTSGRSTDAHQRRRQMGALNRYQAFLAEEQAQSDPPQEMTTNPF